MSRIDEINAILDDLGEAATYEQVEYALRDYEKREVLEVIADRQISTIPEVRKVTVALNNTQIKALPSSRFEVIAATEILGYVGTPTTLPIPLQAWAFISAGATGYSNFETGDCRLLLVWGSDWSLSASALSYQGLPTPAWVATFFQSTNRVGYASFGGPDYDSGAGLTASLEDNGLYLTFDSSGVGDLAGGDASTTLTLTVVYTTVVVP